MSWRTEARRAIDQALAEADRRGLMGPERETLVRASYPFGPREMYPYRVWLDEVSRTLHHKRTSLSRPPQAAGSEAGRRVADDGSPADPLRVRRLRRREVYAVLADRPIPWRERWGRLANELSDRGTPWPDDEIRAFDQVEAERIAGLDPSLPRIVERRGTPTRQFFTVELNLK